jgi:hypothetical protein
MEPIVRHIHFLNVLCRIEGGQNIIDPIHHLRRQLASVASVVKSFQPAVFK